MPKKVLPYKEGDWFAIPLKDGGYASGIIARASRGGVLLGYFFGPRHKNMPSAEEILGLDPGQAIFIGMFGDLGLLQSEWSIIAKTREWRREAWPVPDFGRVDSINTDIAYRITYDENRLTHVIRELRVTPEEARSLPEDGLFGYVALELRLNRLLP